MQALHAGHRVESRPGNARKHYDYIRYADDQASNSVRALSTAPNRIEREASSLSLSLSLELIVLFHTGQTHHYAPAISFSLCVKEQPHANARWCNIISSLF